MMDKELQNAFTELRSDAPKISFDVTSRRFLTSNGVGVLGISLALFFRKWNYLHWIIMTTTGISITALTLFFSGSVEEGPTANTMNNLHYADSTAFPEKTIDIAYYSADSQLLQTVHHEGDKLPTVVEFQHLPVRELTSPAYEGGRAKPFEPSDTANQRLEKRVFALVHNMKDTDLMAVEQAAVAAGLNFRYKYVVWGGKVKRIEYWIKWTNPDGKFSERHVILKGKFSSEIGWMENGERKAVSILE